MQNAAVGFRAHMGWVAAVAIALEEDAPRLVRATIFETAEEGDRIAKEPYHAAGGWDGVKRVPRPADPKAVIEQGRKRQQDLATRAIAVIANDLKSRKLKLIRGVVLSTRSWLGHSLEGILSDHAHVHVYEGEAVRDAVRAALKANRIASRAVSKLADSQSG
jgi:hypothetical protein